MATSKVVVNPADGWVKVADAADEQFLVEQHAAGSREAVLFRLDDGVPAATAVGHQLIGRDAMPRMGKGDAYVKAVNVEAVLVVTK